MQIAFISNFLNHHQLPLCKEFLHLTRGRFYFIATESISEERLQLGYADMNEQYDFVLCPYKDDTSHKRMEEILLTSDILIVGGIGQPIDYIKERLKKKKITFYYCERLFKPSFAIKPYDPRMIRYIYRNFLRYRKHPYYMLCAGEYVAADYKKYGAFESKKFRWGYFPEQSAPDYHQICKERERHNQKIHLLWVGRYLHWKHPLDAIQITKNLLEDGYDVKLNMIGEGTEYSSIHAEIAKLQLEDSISILGSLPYEKISEYMIDADIFLFLSDFEEGWGAVLNEAMSCGCAVVANRAAGATLFLIKDGYNGYTYENGNLKELYYKAALLAKDSDTRQLIGKHAYDTIKTEWNHKIAANRLIELYNAITSNAALHYENGPCSKII